MYGASSPHPKTARVKPASPVADDILSDSEYE
jgi:hypothetical protein